MALVRRCRHCYYVIDNLPEPRCPECGEEFDPDNPASYTTKPPFVRSQYWLPAFIMALAIGLTLLFVLIPLAGFGWTVTIVVPMCAGIILGYGCRVSKFVLILLGIVVAGGFVLGLYEGGILGAFCGIVFGIIIFLPILAGIMMGQILRASMKQRSFSQRAHLPLFLCVILLPLGTGGLEIRFHRPQPIEAVSTSIVLPAPVARAWDAVIFYENVHHAPPFLLRHILPHPLSAHGSMARVGDKTVCVYSKGKLVKRITEREPGKLLAFDVEQQVNIENRSIRLTDGSFAFEAIGPSQTNVCLTTRYEPLLWPRWIWRPFETLAVHELHGHVLEGMRLKSIEDGRTAWASPDK